MMYDLAMKGELPRLGSEAAKLEESGAQFVPFARELRRLVEGFEEEQILTLIGQFLKQPE